MKTAILPLFESQQISKLGSEALGQATETLRRIDLYRHLKDKILQCVD